MKVTKHLTAVYPNDVQEPDKKAFGMRVTSLSVREGDKCLKGNLGWLRCFSFVYAKYTAVTR